MAKVIRIIILFLVGISVVTSLQVNAASRASLSFSPASGSYEVGDVVSVNILVGSPDQPMNAVSGVVSFPPSKLEVISLSKTDSVLSIWLHEPSFSNSLGTITLKVSP